MVELEHRLPEPTGLRSIRVHAPGSTWECQECAMIRPEIKRQLHQEQSGLCVYCEKKLTPDEGHIDHIKPRWSFTERIFEYSNLAQSCNSSKSCGGKKDKRILPIEPRPGCNEHFMVSALDGRLHGVEDLPADTIEKAEESIEILGLNAPALAWDRKKWAETLLALSPADRSALLANAPFRWTLKGLCA